MNKKLLTTMFFVCTCAALTVATPIDWDIYEDTTIQTGAVYDWVYIYDSLDEPPEQTTVNMMGGEVDSFVCYDTSQLFFEYGTASYIGGADNSYIVMSGGSVGHSSLTNSSAMHWSGGNIGSYISMYDDAKLHVYGHSLTFTPGGLYGYGNLSGYLEDNTYFDIFFRSLPQPFEDMLGTNIFLVPEPTTVLLFTIGGLLLRRSRK